MVSAGVKNVYCAHYHRRAHGLYKGLKVMVTGALGTSIFTKDEPEDMKGNEVAVASFKVSGEAFNGLGAKEDKSGLYVVTVGKTKVLKEKWMSIADMKKATMQEEKSHQVISKEQTAEKKAEYSQVTDCQILSVD